MPILANFTPDKQDDPNSCWACAGRCISNYFVATARAKTAAFYSDQEFAFAWARATNSGKNSDKWQISIQQSASAALSDLGYLNYTFDTPFPTVQEITEAINEPIPLLAIIAANKPLNGRANLGAQNGHWVVIVGISDNGATIDVFDPDNGRINTVAYNAESYNGVYWQNTSYFQF